VSTPPPTSTDARIVDAAGGVLGWLLEHGEATLYVVGALFVLIVLIRVGYNVASALTDLRLKRTAGDAAGALAAYLGRDAAGRSGEYQSYLQSDAWRARRERTLMLAGGWCQRCGGARATDAHHVTYVRLGREADGDLEALCARCHAEAHGR
jgi:HNH endonuclease